MEHLCLDVTDCEALLAAAEGCEAMVHLAAYPSPAGRPAHQVHNANVVASYNAVLVAAVAGMHHYCYASSVNAIGGAFSVRPRYDYFPLDEAHQSYTEDPYSLSKWEGEQQASSVCRRYPALSAASLRLHYLVESLEVLVARMRQPRTPAEQQRFDAFAARDLWGYTSLGAAARACLDAVTAPWEGHEVFYIVAPRTWADVPSPSLHLDHYAGVPLRRPLAANDGFYDCDKARRLLAWEHDPAGRHGDAGGREGDGGPECDVVGREPDGEGRQPDGEGRQPDGDGPAQSGMATRSGRTEVLP